MCQTRGLGSDPLEDVVDETVHDRHGFAADAGIRVHLLQHLVDVNGIALLSLSLPFLVAGTNGFGLAGLLGAFRAHFWWHGDEIGFLSITRSAMEMKKSFAGFFDFYRSGLVRALKMGSLRLKARQQADVCGSYLRQISTREFF